MTQVEPQPRVGTDLEIARAATMQPIEQVARRLDIGPDDLHLYGRYKAKIDLSLLGRLGDRPQGRLVLVTAISPTPAGEGKTTTSVGLADALNRLGKATTLCLREPSLGPCFGMKGGAAGGGYAQVVPMEDINLHFTGDFHAITAAHNLLAAAIDNHLHRGNALQIDVSRISWRRVLDLNDRSLRDVVTGLGGSTNGPPRQTGFDITAASEIMAILTLAASLDDLRARLARIVVAETREGKPVTAADLHMQGAMTALLKDALMPNLVQTLEGNPALVHGGPFGNIAHGCNSVVATSLALRLGEYTVTEAGFGADLGAQKFFDIKCRSAGLHPDAVVLVATLRALKFQGGVNVKDVSKPNPEALVGGLDHLAKHVENLQRYGVPVVVCINEFAADTDAEVALVEEAAERLSVPVVRSDHWARGGLGAEALGQAVIEAVESGRADFELLYPDDLSLLEKARTISRLIYGADDIEVDASLRKRFEKLDATWGRLPVCMAKTQYSFSTDPKAVGRPRGFTIPIRDVVVRAGAGFVLVLTGEIMTMPGLPKVPAAEAIDVDSEGHVTGLF